MTGFGKDPTNPFYNNIIRQPDVQRQPAAAALRVQPGPAVPRPQQHPPDGIRGCRATTTRSTTGRRGDRRRRRLNFYAYFSAYGNGNYDPNDVNFAEADGRLSGPIGLKYTVEFPDFRQHRYASRSRSRPRPIPYTSTLTTPDHAGRSRTRSRRRSRSSPRGSTGSTASAASTSQSASIAATFPLPLDPNNTYAGIAARARDNDPTIRQRVRQPDQFQVRWLSRDQRPARHALMAGDAGDTPPPSDRASGSTVHRARKASGSRSDGIRQRRGRFRSRSDRGLS